MKYADAGVDVAKADKAMSAIKSMVKSTYTKGVLGDFGSFGGLFEFPLAQFKKPVLVSSVDGVGTKLALAIETKNYSSIGEDIVNHCVDDILVQGAQPLFFLDYYSTGVLDEKVLIGVLEGITKACKENKCALMGGETAEMPGFYKKGDFDLAGTIVGVADKEHLITGQNIQEGDELIGLCSSGLHTNGYSLARKVLFEKAGYVLSQTLNGFKKSLSDILLEPHRSYLHCIIDLIPAGLLKGLIHITGGGFQGNIPRVLPSGFGVEIDKSSWQSPPIFDLIQSAGEVDNDEMFRTFNMGIGMMLICSPSDLDPVRTHLQNKGEKAIKLGRVIALPKDATERVLFQPSPK